MSVGGLMELYSRAGAVQQEQRNRWRMELYRLAFARGDGVCSRARTSVNQQSAETQKKNAAVMSDGAKTNRSMNLECSEGCHCFGVQNHSACYDDGSATCTVRIYN